MKASKLEIGWALGLVLLAAVLIIGCGTTSSGGGFANVDVQFTVSGDRISHNANESIDFTVPGAGTDFRKLTWFCGNYKDRQRSRVELTFKKTNNTWVLDKEDFSGGTCA
jgi:hypothetical protein